MLGLSLHTHFTTPENSQTYIFLTSRLYTLVPDAQCFSLRNRSTVDHRPKITMSSVQETQTNKLQGAMPGATFHKPGLSCKS